MLPISETEQPIDSNDFDWHNYARQLNDTAIAGVRINTNQERNRFIYLGNHSGKIIWRDSPYNMGFPIYPHETDAQELWCLSTHAPTEILLGLAKPQFDIEAPSFAIISSAQYLDERKLLMLMGVAPDPKVDLLEQLKKLKNTPEDERWPGAKWPTEEAFRDAKEFIDKLSSELAIKPHISLADDGEVNFFWKNDEGIYVDLGFYGTGTYSYFAKDGKGYEDDDEKIPVLNGLLPEIEKFLIA